MAIIEDIKGTLTKTGKAAAKKTKNIAEIAKLTSEIEETKSLIRGVYTEIGKKYCELYNKETAEDSFTVDIATVENLKEQLSALKSEKLKLRGKIQCPECAESVDKGFTFCPHCGAMLPEFEASVDDTSEEDFENNDDIDAIDADEEIDEDEE